MMILFGEMAAALLTVATPAATSVVTTAKPEEKLTCRKYMVTGSLVRYKRVCHTRADWKRIEDGARRNTQELQDSDNGTRTSG